MLDVYGKTNSYTYVSIDKLNISVTERGEKMKDKLIHMKDKLNNINNRNRSIRLLKLYNKWSFDLTELDPLSGESVSASIVEKIINTPNKDIVILKPTLEKESQALSKKLTDLSRNMKGIEEETGLHDFYLGYPFLSGTLADGTFFQAPLFLYPVRLEKTTVTGMRWILKGDEGSPQINRTLILAFRKLNNVTFTEDFFEKAAEVATNASFEVWLQFLKEYDFTVGFAPTGLSKLKEYKREDIPESAPLTMLEHAVIGNFPQGSSSLVKDFEELIELSSDGSLGLAGELIDPEDEVPGVEEEKDSTLEPTESVAEQDQLYLLQTDGSQEEILQEARYRRGLVVHGPPGTGKSQVIVNLITDALNQKKKILVVCQKRAALDVVYQRLDSLGLSSHIALVHDEKQDRKKLYTKITNLLERNVMSDEQILALLHSTSKKLAGQEEQLNSIAKALFEYQPYGYRLYDLYGKAKPIEETAVLLEIDDLLGEINRDNLDDITEKVYTYAEWYANYGGEDYPLKNRKSFAAFDIKDKLKAIEVLNGLLQKAKSSVEYMDSLDHDKITPAYTWLVNNKLEKITPDLIDPNKRTMQGLRLWWWTTFSGKQIIEELLKGEKFKGVNSTEWLKVREGLVTMHKLATETLKMSEEIERLKSYMDDDLVIGMKNRISQGDIPQAELDKMLEYFHRDFEDLQQMDLLWASCSDLERKIISRLKKKSDSENRALPEFWAETFKNSTYIHWIQYTEKRNPQVQKVSTPEYMRLRESFAVLLSEKRNLAKQAMVHQLTKQVEAVQSEKERRVRELKYQVGKKRQIWPLRRLVSEFADDGLVDILPVWLASPEIVSAIFPLVEGLFDLVIFDEASQLTVEGGIPAVYRAKQVVIAGDEKQLPPFNMFQSSVVNEDDEEQYEIDESPSLLNLAKRRFSEKILQWHYRSQYEELINFSNHAFYHGHVQIAPNVTPFKEPPAIQWKKVDGRWMNQCNEVEAIEVVDLLKKLLIERPGKTVGIITFNAKQQSKIQDIIDKQIQEDEEFNTLYAQQMAKDLDERVFIKNIENVQGDERDIILFSIAYAKNEEGRVYNRFGMLNQKGGENRLNVAVTRAKEEIIVVSSIEPEELNVANSSSVGPKLFKSYLKYVRGVAKLQKEQIDEVIREVNEEVHTQVKASDLHFDSPFEEQVYQQLKNIGYEVVTQVGMSGYRIDMAIVHPHDTSRFILGIECDGAMYHSSKNAKERDVYRQKFLESRGWTIERIWSRNWWRNPSAEIERIDQVIKGIL
jgi:very-short-patch-repair endonuclease/DNA polymerase III delta prime subunit